jgi:hypothetical protein
VSQPVAVQLRRVPSRAPVDLNRSANRPQLQLIAHPNSAPINERLRQRDLKLPGHLRHEPIISPIKDLVKDLALIPGRVAIVKSVLNALGHDPFVRIDFLRVETPRCYRTSPEHVGERFAWS